MQLNLRIGVSLTALICLFAVGCGGSGPVYYDVTGKVTYNDAPVKEGEISFENSDKGYAATSTLNNGEYKVSLPAASYKVVVRPVMEEVGGSPDSPPSLQYKKVDDIPKKYRETATSGLTAEVTPSVTSFSFGLAP